jgi:hypothetical protein
MIASYFGLFVGLIFYPSLVLKNTHGLPWPVGGGVIDLVLHREARLTWCCILRIHGDARPFRPWPVGGGPLLTWCCVERLD